MMNLRTTLVLLILVAAGGLLSWYGPTSPLKMPGFEPGPGPVTAPDAGTRAVLDGLRDARFTRIEVRRGDQVVQLRRGPGGTWSMPGHWPTRQAEVQALVSLLAGLHSRFEPEPITRPDDLKKYGLEPPALTVHLETPEHRYTLALGEPDVPPGDGSRFARPTYVRLQDRPEVVRLEPGLVAALDRPADYYLQRRLFPGERVPREDNPQEKVEQLAARGLTLQDTKERDHCYQLLREKDQWQLSAPVRDRLDPSARAALLAAVPDLWAEDFVATEPGAVAGAVLAPPGGTEALAMALFLTTRQGLVVRSGLAAPQRTLSVTRADGETVTLLIGNPSGARSKTVLRPPPPGLPPGSQPLEETVREEYRYARLKDNDQVFEIKSDKLKDVFVPLGTLRDAQLVRFKSEDAVRLEVRRPPEPAAAAGLVLAPGGGPAAAATALVLASRPGVIEPTGQTIVLAKVKDRWKLVEPLQADADESLVTDLLSKLSGAEARNKDVIDRGDPRKYGLGDRAATVSVIVRETTQGAGRKQEKKEWHFTLRIGKHEARGKKVYVQVEGWPRINAVDDSLAPLVRRPALAYRGKRVLDFDVADLDRIEVKRGGEMIALRRQAEGWRLTAPVSTEADAVRAGQLASSLSSLETLEYVNNAPSPEQLKAEYGLDRPALAVTLTFKDRTKAPRTLEMGQARGKKAGYFARLADGPAVFAISKEVHDQLDRDSLAYRPLQLWQAFPEDVTAVAVHRVGQPEYRLARDGNAWRIAGPFDAPALADAVQKLAGDLASPQAERYTAHQARNPASYGLANPGVAVTISTRDGRSHTLLIGKPAGKEGPGRFAQLAGSPAVFVVNDALARSVDRSALDLLDPVLVREERDRINRVEGASGNTALTLERQGEEWRVIKAPGAPFSADGEAVRSLLDVWSSLRAERFAAYGPRVDWQHYGLDRPGATATVHAGQMEAHTIQLGKFVQGNSGPRYARLDQRPGVAVLSATEARVLARTPLDYVDHTMLRLDPGAVRQVQRHMGKDVLDVVKQEEGWQLTKPVTQRADEKAVQDLLAQLADLRAQRIAAYPASDLAPFGLDRPTAVVTITMAGDDRPGEHRIQLGKEADRVGGRYALVDGGRAVAVLAGGVAERLLAGPLAFRDRGLAQFADADRVRLRQGLRRAVFAKVEGSWKLVEPLQAEAEHDELEDFVNTLARLRADQLVAEKPGPSELKKYGLDRPEADWRLLSGDREVLHLLVGNKEEKGPRRYARLAGGDLVFLLDPGLSAKVVGEFRPRGVWGMPLDAAQVESLAYGYRHSPFTLERGTDSAWHVAGKPELKVNEAAINDTLAALADLKLARYALDKGADPKLFGLEPPELRLVVTTRAGKRVLEVGGQEGGSRRRYARVAEADRSDVFVLDEPTCARLLRQLAAFTRRGP